jgi:hypothetical protein
MAHWAEIDKSSIVIRVLVTNNDDLNEGYDWLVENLGGTWVKTSYNTLSGVHYLSDEQRDENGNRIPSGESHLRYNYASINYTYDPIRDAFIPPKPEEGDWVLNKDTCQWEEVLTETNL